MRLLRAWVHRVLAVVGRDRQDRELRDELESHLEMHIDDNRRAGMNEIEARRHALVRLGGVAQVTEQYRDRRGISSLDIALGDVRFALRLLRRSPAFTAVVLATLAVGIGANTVMFSVVNTVLLRPLPYRDAGRLVSVQTVDAKTRNPGAAAVPDFYDYRRLNRSLSSLEAFYTQPVNLTGGDAERLPALIVSGSFFDTLGTPPVLGRGFVAQDEQWGSHRVAVLSDGLWQRRYGGDPNIVGRPITLNGESFVVVGVLPATFSFLGIDAQLIVPMSFAPGDHMNSHSNYFLRMVGRLQPGVTADQAASDLTRISDAIIATHPLNAGTVIAATPLQELLVRDVRRGVLVLLGAVGFVLLIACANLANLLLARAAVRQREIAVRLALGASRGRLLRQFLAESLLLSGLGGTLGLAMAYLSVGAVNTLSQGVLPRAGDVEVDAMVLTFTCGVAMGVGILLGLAPAAQSVTRDVNTSLKDGARTASGAGGRYRFRKVLVVAEVALSLVLLIGAGLLVKSMYQLLRVDAGFDPDRVLTIQLNVPPQKYVDRDLERQFSPDAYARLVAFFSGVTDRVRSVPGVVAAGAINGLPLMGPVWGKNVTLYDRPFPADINGLPPIQFRVVTGDYFRAMGVRIRDGRSFTDADSGAAPRVAIINGEMARRHWPGVSPIGKIISVNPPLQLVPRASIDEARRAGVRLDDYVPDKFTIVGVAEDTRYSDLHTAAVPLVYAPFAQGSEGTTNMFLVVRAQSDPLALVASIREQIARIDRDQPVANIQTMEGRLSASVAQRRLQMQVLGAFALIAALLAAIGIYGVTSYAVAQRARELGIRLALGAGRREVIGLMLRQGFALVGVGLVLGLVGAVLMTGVLRALLFEVSTTDPLVFSTIVVLLSLTALVATYLPAQRAARVDPLVTLRAE